MPQNAQGAQATRRSHGAVGCDVQCAGPDCWNTRRFTFDELGVPDDAVVVHVPRVAASAGFS